MKKSIKNFLKFLFISPLPLVSLRKVNAVDVFMSFPQLKYMLYKLRSYMNSKNWANDTYINQVLKEFVSAYEKIINNELEIYCLNETNI
ncbi:hypothetical protein [Mycoplasma nasistruthionis]|uniref:Uncharacterized protein n=1 Tax=Mycoplasma nasistruthionis TaxID=353852 RepID=A0A5B7XW04_9MOLU|nr:hypothetical protein [Mycoplasma nasistruthionis]QCZ36907.1 hypothetical protein FG904_02740 [Mycoplasma nasistruthionis]